MKKTLFLLCAVILGASCNSAPATQPLPAQVTISKERLLDKIKGGWAGQTIGCTYGGPTEFKFNGTMIQEYTPIPWPEHYIKWWYENTPGLYDDVYMDLTFVEVFDRLGIDAPVDSLAAAFANAGYVLWHANQAARYNILNGIRPPESGHWLNNPHADDLDFQIEADFAGLMSPGMPNAASEFCDRAGHIMNYGDGWYGGVYVAAMYSLSFVSDDIGFIVEEALKTIPEQSRYHRCMKDVIAWHKQYPGDWKRTWFECEKKWSSDIGCPDGVFVPFNIDAVTNSAYILIGLLYGEGDFDGIDNLEKELLAQNAEHKDWACTEELMKTTKDGKALYLHCLPADITGVSCETGEVDASVFDRYRIPLYKEASFKPYIIAAMIMLSKFENPQDILKKLEVKAAPRILK